MHITTICDRGYVLVVNASGDLHDERTGGSRHLAPTQLGTAIISGFDAVLPALVMPRLRASMESQIASIASGGETKQSVVRRP